MYYIYLYFIILNIYKNNNLYIFKKIFRKKGLNNYEMK